MSNTLGYITRVPGRCVLNVRKWDYCKALLARYIKVEFIEITKDGVSEAIHGSTKKESKQYTQMGKILLEEEDDKNKEKQTNIQSGRQ